MKTTTLLPTFGLATLALTAAAGTSFGGPDGTCAATKVAWTGEKDIVQTAVAAGDFKTLAKALEAAGLVGALQGEGPFTVFAPTDAAFARLPEGTLEKLLKPESRGVLETILTYHVVPGRVPAAKVLGIESAQALNGQRIPVSVTDEGVRVAGSKVVKTDIACSNGIIHVVDEVMLPATVDLVQTAINAGDFKTLAAALKAGGLVEALKGEGPFTVFAPTDAAFAALPEGTLESLLKPENKQELATILKYHVVPGRIYADQLSNGKAKTLEGASVQVQVDEYGVQIDSARVSTADVETTNGVIHVIDRVLLPK